MEFITAEQFLKQDKEVQKVFIDWWEPSEFDVYSIKEDLSSHRVCKSDIEDYKNDELYNIKSGYCIPLLTEGQLRKFIEDKTNMNINLDYICSECGYSIVLTCYDRNSKPFIDLGNNILQAYWKVAIQIAEEEVLNEKNNKNNK